MNYVHNPLASLTKVTKAATNSKSLRTTIPEDIVSELKISRGDLLIWSNEEKKGKKTITIEKWE